MSGDLRILPLFAPRVVRMMTGRFWSAVPSVPPELSYSSTWSRTNCAVLGSYSPFSGTVPPSDGGVVVGEVVAQLAGGLGLGEEFPRLGLGGLDGVRAGDEALQGLVLAGDGEQGAGELGRVAGLPAVHALHALDPRGGAGC